MRYYPVECIGLIEKGWWNLADFLNIVIKNGLKIFLSDFLIDISSCSFGSVLNLQARESLLEKRGLDKIKSGCDGIPGFKNWIVYEFWTYAFFSPQFGEVLLRKWTSWTSWTKINCCLSASWSNHSVFFVCNNICQWSFCCCCSKQVFNKYQQ